MIHRFAIGQTDFGITTTASGGAGSVNISAGTTSISSNAFTFSNSNGVTFGIDTNAQITASVQTNYQSPGAYLTTAMASNRGSDFVQATAGFHGTNASGTIASSGISVSVAAPAAQSINISAGTTSSNVTAVTFSNANGVSFGYDGTNVTATVATNYQSQGAYLTTAMQSNAATISNIKISAGASSSNVSAVTFSNANGVSFGYDGTNVTATVATNYQSQGAYLTTAALSQDSSKYAGTGTSATNASITLNTAGLAISVAAGSNSSWTVSDAATSITVARLAFTNSNGLTLSLSTTTGGSATLVGSYTVPTVTNSSWTVSDANTSATVGRLAFTNSNGLTLSLSTSNNGNHTVIGSYTVPTVTNSSWTVSDAATSMTIGRLAFTNSNGLTLTLSTTTGGLATVIGSYTVPSTAGLISAIKLSAGTLSNNLSAITFSDSNGISWGLNTNSVITATVKTNYAGTNTAVSTTAGTDLTFAANTSGITIAYPAWLTTAALSQDSSKYAGTNSAITGGSMTVNTSGVSVNIPIATLSYFENIPLWQNTAFRNQGAGSKLQVLPFLMPQVMSAGYLRLLQSMQISSASQTGTSANTSFSLNRTYTHAMILYTQGTGANSMSLRYSTSTSATWVFQTSISAANTGSQYTVTYNITYPTQGTTSQYTTSYATTDTQYDINTTILSLFTNQRFLDIPFAQSISPGNYWLGLGSSSTDANPNGPAALKNGTVSFNTFVITNATSLFGYPGAATNSSIGVVIGMGEWSTNSAVLSTSSIGLNSITSQTGDNGRIYFQFIRQA